jgi:hypothetical protein
MRDGYVPCTRCLRQYLKAGLTPPSGQQVANTVSEAEEEHQEQEQEEDMSIAGH